MLNIVIFTKNSEKEVLHGDPTANALIIESWHCGSTMDAVQVAKALVPVVNEWKSLSDEDQTDLNLAKLIHKNCSAMIDGNLFAPKMKNSDELKRDKDRVADLLAKYVSGENDRLGIEPPGDIILFEAEAKLNVDYEETKSVYIDTEEERIDVWDVFEFVGFSGDEECEEFDAEECNLEADGLFPCGISFADLERFEERLGKGDVFLSNDEFREKII